VNKMRLEKHIIKNSNFFFQIASVNELYKLLKLLVKLENTNQNSNKLAKDLEGSNSVADDGKNTSNKIDSNDTNNVDTANETSDKKSENERSGVVKNVRENLLKGLDSLGNKRNKKRGTGILPQTSINIVNEKEGTKSNNDKGKKKDDKAKKAKPKKQAKPDAFLTKAIKVGKVKNVDRIAVMNQLLLNIQDEEESWNRMWKCLKVLNVLILIVVMGINLLQVLVQVLNLDKVTLRILSTCLPVVSSLFISFQNKFSWDDKADISKKSLEFYRKMLKHVETRIRLEEVGGKVTDVINLWNASLVSEMKDIPQTVLPY